MRFCALTACEKTLRLSRWTVFHELRDAIRRVVSCINVNRRWIKSLIWEFLGSLLYFKCSRGLRYVYFYCSAVAFASAKSYRSQVSGHRNEVSIMRERRTTTRLVPTKIIRDNTTHYYECHKEKNFHTRRGTFFSRRIFGELVDCWFYIIALKLKPDLEFYMFKKYF